MMERTPARQRIGRILRSGGLFVALMAGLIGSAWADFQPKRYSLEEMTNQADAIVIGRVKEKKSRFHQGVIRTSYTIEISQSLKGKVAPTLSLEQLGGQVEGFPIQQKLVGQPTLFKGEKALLFLNYQPKMMDQVRANNARSRDAVKRQMASQGKPAPRFYEMAPDDPFLTTMVISASWQGHYAIFSDEKTGEEFAMQVSPELGGAVSDESSFAAFKAMQEKFPEPLAPGEAEPELNKAAPVEPKSDEQMLDEFLAPKNRRPRAVPLETMKNTIRLEVARQEISNQTKSAQSER